MARNLKKLTRQSNEWKRNRSKKRYKAKARTSDRRALEKAKRRVPETGFDQIVQDKLSRRERAQIADIRSVIYIRAFFTLVFLALFSWLNYEVMSLVRDIFEKTGSLDKEVIMTLIAGTVSQVAAVTYVIAQFLFPKTRE